MKQLRTNHRRGVVALLAMLYLVLFSALSIGFYSATTTSVQIVNNEERSARSLLAAESGMDFLRYQVSQVTIAHGTQLHELFREVGEALEDQLEDTGNCGDIYVDSERIVIPAQGWIALRPSTQLNDGEYRGEFKATVQNMGQKIRVKVVGRYEGVATDRAVQMDYDLAEKASDIFNFGVASRGAVYTGGSSRIRGATDPKKGSVLSASADLSPVRIDGLEVSGDISISNPDGTVVFGANTSIGGTTDDTIIREEHIHVGVAEPEFPTIDTTMFLPFVTDPSTGLKRYYGSGSLVENVVIRAGTNPTFTGATIKGVVYVEQPNRITFRGTTSIEGMIVVDTVMAPSGTPATNLLDFAGGVSAASVAGLTPEEVPSLSSDLYSSLVKLTGSFILAPNFHTQMTGNFGTVAGSIVAGKVSMTGNAGGTVVGSVITTTNAPLTLNGSSEIIIASTGTTDYPPGVFFSSHYVPLADTYEEVKP